MMFERDHNGVLHVVALSGGHDSTILSLELAEREPRPYTYICTPTGNELPEMYEHWRKLGEMLGCRVVPVMAATLFGTIEKERTLPNFRRRFCTKIIKILPYRRLLMQQAALGPIVSYVGLRADEPGRAGGAYDDIPGVKMRFPLREWGWGEEQVQAGLASRGVVCPLRTDCAVCYHQKIGEWYELWRDYPNLFAEGEALEAKYNETFRTPARGPDGGPVFRTRVGVTFAVSAHSAAWPTSLRDIRLLFEAGVVPTVSLNNMARERMSAGSCRVCSM